MLTTKEATSLIHKLKKILSDYYFQMPLRGGRKDILLQAVEAEREKFYIIVTRNSSYHPRRHAITLRYGNQQPLLRLDIDCVSHTNPDGSTVTSDHLHVYREGFELSYAYPLTPPLSQAVATVDKLREFMLYSGVIKLEGFVIAQGDDDA